GASARPSTGRRRARGSARANDGRRGTWASARANDGPRGTWGSARPINGRRRARGAAPAIDGWRGTRGSAPAIDGRRCARGSARPIIVVTQGDAARCPRSCAFEPPEISELEPDDDEEDGKHEERDGRALAEQAGGHADLVGIRRQQVRALG